MRGICVLLLLASVGQARCWTLGWAGLGWARLGWPQPDLPDAADKKTVLDARLEEVANAMFNDHKQSVAFCLGNGLPEVLSLLQVSFPSPLPTGPDEDPICSNATRIEAHLCGPEELALWYRVSLQASSLGDSLWGSLLRVAAIRKSTWHNAIPAPAAVHAGDR